MLRNFVTLCVRENISPKLNVALQKCGKVPQNEESQGTKKNEQEDANRKAVRQPFSFAHE